MTVEASCKPQKILILALGAAILMSALPSLRAAAPVAGFTYDPPAPSTADLITFTDASTDDWNNLTNHTWDLGDGTIHYGPVVQHQYADNGTYLVVLNVTDNETFYDTYSALVVVSNVGPAAAFTSSPPAPSTADNVSFTDASTDSDGVIVNWTWDFGDGNGSYLSDPTHRYGDDGDYNVTLTVTDDDGATSLANATVRVSNQAPASAFGHAPAAPATGETISFTDASSDADGTIANWTWDFGDGNGSYLSSPTHAYPADGTYNVTLTVTDDDGASDAYTLAVSVSNQAPNASFIASSLYGSTRTTFTFTDTSSDPDGVVVNQTWDLGDGTTLYGALITHQYATNGTYLVVLTVTDDDGAMQSTNASLTVNRTGGGGIPYLPPPEVATSMHEDALHPGRFLIHVPVGPETHTVTIDVPPHAPALDGVELQVSGAGYLEVLLERRDAPALPGFSMLDGFDIEVEEHGGSTVITRALVLKGAASFDDDQLVLLHDDGTSWEILATADGRAVTPGFSTFAVALDVEAPVVLPDGAGVVATDNRAIRDVRLFVDGEEVPVERDGDRYSIGKTLGAGIHAASAVVTDESGLVTVQEWSFVTDQPAASGASDDAAPVTPRAEQEHAESGAPYMLVLLAVGSVLLAVLTLVRKRE